MNKNIFWQCGLIAALAIFGVRESSAHAKSGGLDLTFGNGGIVRSSIYTPAPLQNMVMGTVAHPDGKVSILGYSNGVIQQPVGAPSSWFAHRYNENGHLDFAFANYGQLVKIYPDVGVDISGALQSDGKMIINRGSGVELLRINPDGSLDPAFGKEGSAKPGLGFFFSKPIIQPDGKILLTGCYNGGSGTPTGNHCMSSMYRFNPDGSPDSTFGQAGRMVLTSSLLNRGLYSPVLKPDGKIVALNSKTTTPYGTLGYGELLQFLPDGSLDTSFVGGLIPHEGGYDTFGAVVISPEGKILVSGTRSYDEPKQGTRFHPFLRGYLSDGQVDKSFGSNNDGFVFLRRDPDPKIGYTAEVVGFDRQSRNAIVFMAKRSYGVSYVPGYSITRVSETGAIDRSFGNQGYISEPKGLEMTTFGMAVAANGKLVVGGYVKNGDRTDAAIVRYLP